MLLDSMIYNNMPSVQQIKDRLLKVIDKDGNVLNQSIALEIVVMLENTTITKDELEETRLGKYINLVRRAAKDPVLQKRAKKLIKTWQQMIANPTQTPKKVAEPSSYSERAPRASNIKNNKHIPTTVNGDTSASNHSKRKHETSYSKNDKRETKTKSDSKSPRASSKPSTKSSEANPSKFTCMTNGLKVKFTSLPSTTSPPKEKSVKTNERKLNEDKVKLKRKRQDESVQPETSYLSRTTNLTKLPVQSAYKSEKLLMKHQEIASPIENTTRKTSDTRLIKEEVVSSRIDTTKETQREYLSKPILNITEVDAPCSSDLQYGNAILHASSIREMADEIAGVDGCRVNNGTWYTWAESLSVKRMCYIAIESEETNEPDLLNILPYVELD